MRGVLLRLGQVDQRVAEDDGEGAEEAADDDGKEDQALLLKGEVVDAREDVGHGSEEAEEGGELAGDVETDEADDRLEEKHFQRPEERDRQEGSDTRFDGRFLRGGRVGVFEVAALEDWVVGFFGEETHYKTGNGEEDEGPLGPPPAFAVGDERTNDGARIFISDTGCGGKVYGKGRSTLNRARERASR